MRSITILPITCCVALIVGSALAPSTSSAADPTTYPSSMQFDIKPQPLATALNAFALQSHQQILFTPEIAKGKTTQGIHGSLTAEAALTQLLAGTGLSSSRSAEGMLMVTLADAKGASASAGPSDAPNGASNNQIQSGQSNKTTPNLEEIIVTAQKRNERLQDVPVPVTVLSADALVENDQTRLRDYFESVPGFTVSPGPSAGNQQMLTIRGISSGAFGNPTVGVTVDDVPFGAFTREYAPDIDPSDLARVEVLRGPQGTLYGASSMGGLLKFVTVDPSTEALTGRIEAGTNSVYNGAELGYNFRGSINVPLTDSLALRASAFTREDPGYIDNPRLGSEGVNEDRVSGGRLSLLWRFADTFSLKLSALTNIQRRTGSVKSTLHRLSAAYNRITSVVSAAMTKLFRPTAPSCTAR